MRLHALGVFACLWVYTDWDVRRGAGRCIYRVYTDSTDYIPYTQRFCFPVDL